MTAPGTKARRAIAAAQLLLLAPASLFMLAVFARAVRGDREPSHGAQQVVMWFAARRWTLAVLLVALPLAALALGGATLRSAWREDAELRRVAAQALSAVRPHRAVLIVAVATIAAAAILAVVIVHVLTD